MVVVGLVTGVLGSLLDSLLGATLQATYYSAERKCIVKSREPHCDGDQCFFDPSIVHVCGYALLSNEAVNWLSIALTMAASVVIAPMVFCFFDESQCGGLNFAGYTLSSV
jgi:uncharacterized membrane protein